MRKFKINNPKGMSLVEVMIVMTIMSMIGLGTATLMKNMFSIQNRANLKSVASEIQDNLVNILKNDTAWANSINDAVNAASLGCLRDGVPAACVDGNTYAGWRVRNNDAAPGGIYYAGHLPTAGFDITGAPCNAYNIAGNDACPFRYNLTWLAECGSRGDPCTKPAVTITGVFAFSPTDPSDPRNRINVDEYRFTIERGERSRYEPFELRHALNGGGGGACNAGGWAQRPLSQEVYDIGNNVTLAGNRFVVQPGTYECKVVAQSYEAMTGFNIRLEDTTNNNDYMVGGGFSGFNSTAYATGTVTFQLTAPATFELQHYCDSQGPTNPAFDMGIPALAYGDPSVVSSISCVRSS